MKTTNQIKQTNKQTEKRKRTVFHFVVERALISWFVPCGKLANYL
jgi:hypothetical protein